MPLTLHHLTKAQSERIIFLLEELQLPYDLIVHERNPVTALAPDSLKAIHPAGTAPVLIDEPPNSNNDRKVVLAESGAIVEYILSTYAPISKLVKKPGDDGYADYLHYLHYANGTLQPNIGRLMMFSRVGVSEENQMYQFVASKLHKVGLPGMEAQLKKTGAYLAGPSLTAADMMCFFTLTTMRGFCPLDYSAYPMLLEYLKRVSERDAYKRAMDKGDNGLQPLIGAKVEKFAFGPQNQ